MPDQQKLIELDPWTKFYVQKEIVGFLSLEIFKTFKDSKVEKFVTFKANFWESFGYKLIFVAIGVFFILSEIYHWFPRFGWKGELIDLFSILFILCGVFMLINVIISAGFYIHARINSFEYEKSLNKAFSENNNYRTFCNEMSNFDKRYIMHIQRMINENKLSY